MKFPLLFLSAIVLFLSSCIPGKQAAREFVQNRHYVSIMVVPPVFTYMNYYPDDPAWLPDGADTLYSIDDSHLLKEIDIRQAEDMYMAALVAGLENYKLQVFTPDDFDLFLAQPGSKFIFTVAQTEIIEFDDIFEQKALIDTLIYQQLLPIRKISKNTWFEFAEVDSDAPIEVLYSSFIASDYIDGRFRYRWMMGDVSYEYTSYYLAPQDVYNLFQNAGRQNAGYIFDFLLNRYVAQNSSRPASLVYLQFNPLNKKINSGNNVSGFIIIEPQMD